MLKEDEGTLKLKLKVPSICYIIQKQSLCIVRGIATLRPILQKQDHHRT